jgi:hypothetical protein
MEPQSHESSAPSKIQLRIEEIQIQVETGSNKTYMQIKKL